MSPPVDAFVAHQPADKRDLSCHRATSARSPPAWLASESVRHCARSRHRWRTAPRCTSCRRHPRARPDKPDSCYPATSRTRRRTCPLVRWIALRASPRSRSPGAARQSSTRPRRRPAQWLRWVPARASRLRSTAKRCSCRPATNADRHVAFQIGDLARLGAPRFLDNVQLQLAWRIAARDEGQPAIPRPCQSVHGLRAARSLAAEQRSNRCRSLTQTVEFAPSVLSVAAAGFNPRCHAAVRRDFDLAKLVIPKKASPALDRSPDPPQERKVTEEAEEPATQSW